ncbi:DoxX family protein [Aureibaculum marinum]|uniref:DoxX family protein n=1 Tax=Aureibaculum marinum TaxID=2487930 RepID=A0A3N4NJJ1_9FLAO|nr:DoxX family protein [Aureibaculum marinum]RPD96494.1 DoxX family protein [Aureibaculum marinum]
MENLYNTGIKFAPQLLILVFITITFLQSGIDKITDWKGNVSFLKTHFGKTFLRRSVPLLLLIILIGEVIVGFLSIMGIFQIYITGSTFLGFLATVLASKILLMLLFGQRVAKDYAGAMTIAVYFIVTVFGVYLLG